MAKKHRSSVLNRLAGKKVVFSGKFGYGAEESLKAMAEAQQATVLDDLSDKTNYLVLADLTAGKTIQKKAMSLNGKGAAIQVMDAVAFRYFVKPTQDELLGLLKDGNREAFASAVPSVGHSYQGLPPDCPRLVGARLDGLDLLGFDFGGIAFENCSFIGPNLSGLHIVEAIDCDFSKTTGNSPHFAKFDRSCFVGANFNGAEFYCQLAGCDFTSARLDNSRFSDQLWHARVVKKPSDEGPRFTRASLCNCLFDGVCVDCDNFDEADLTGAAFNGCRFGRASLRKVTAPAAFFVDAYLHDADLSNASLVGANLAEADLTGATLDGADLTDANLRGAVLKSSALNAAKGVTSDATSAIGAGPALTETRFRLQQSQEGRNHVSPRQGSR